MLKVHKMEKGKGVGDGENLEGFDVGKSKVGKGRRFHAGTTFGPAIMMVLTGWAFFIVLSGQIRSGDTQALSPEQVDELIDFLKATNPTYTNFTYDQLKQWFEAQTPPEFKFEEFPRLYPFCITASQANDTRRTRTTDHIYRFSEIFQDIERINEKYYSYNVSKHSTHGNTGWISEIRLSRINTPEMDMVNLRQWLHIKVVMKRPMKALYMQSIVGPMGLPFGEFNVDFPCRDDPNTTDIGTVGQLSYCSYRPRTTIQHPSVYVGYSDVPKDEFDMHFFWTDITCMETPYLQFLMIVVEDFNFNATVVGKPRLGLNYQPLLSPIYLNTDFDSKSGAPFPYYPEWKDKMYCFLNNQTFKKTYTAEYGSDFPSKKTGSDPLFDIIDWNQLPVNTSRIQANEAYDACITNRMRDPSLRDDERFECPPGPFRCDTSYASSTTDKTHVTTQRQLLVEAEKNVSNCYPCGAPACVSLGFPDHKCDYLRDDLVKDVNESLRLNEVENILRAKIHGVQACFAFLVLVPLANFLARFYKEMCGRCLCDNGPWIFVHIGAHILSLMFMWISLGPVMPQLTEFRSHKKYCDNLFNTTKEKYNCYSQSSAANPHVALAFFAFVLQHLLVFFGFWRSSLERIRKIQVTLHSHVGYCCWLFGAIATILAGVQINDANDDKCPDVMILACLFFLTPFIFSAAAVALDCLTDRKIGIIPPRRQWPILETIKLEGRGPFNMPKWIIFGVYVAIMVFYWLLVLGGSMKIASSTSSLLDNKGAKPVESFFGFGDCGQSKRITQAEDKNRYEVKKDH